MKKYLTIVSLFLIALVYLQAFHKQHLAAALWAILSILALALVLALAFIGWYATEKMKLIRAGRIEAEKRAHVLAIERHDRVWIRDTDHRATWHALHLEQRVYSNGHYAEPTDLEKLAWFEFNRKQPKIIDAQATQAALPEQAIDLLTALDNAQRTLIVGPSNAGKTTLLQHIISRRRGQVIVIDPHASPNKWPCQTVGIGRDYQAIGEKLAGLVRLMSHRYEEIGPGRRG